MTQCRGIRGAITVTRNDSQEIVTATQELLNRIVQVNNIALADLASAFFTTTVDLNATFPALAARQMGWSEVPLLCAHEMDVPDALGRCIRVLLLWNTAVPPSEIRHVYLRGAVVLRPEL